ncbi:hypothetical protein BV25DRAFT_1919781 [Artomyces pyxidatus]|uniref:Uncharacterized protein n=1 Tax=Artomyces pyxidatus TaxID=48021 RepID=A0ACB8SN42_9AGAM|nr:hypothetical protein BV25DRAFT_1919781 [Artomyces pyxidatus]
MSYQIFGFLVPEDSVREYARNHGLPEDRPGQVVDHIPQAVGLYPRARVMLATHKGKLYPCLVVGSNEPDDHMPILPPKDIQKLMDYMGTTVQPRWWWHY